MSERGNTWIKVLLCCVSFCIVALIAGGYFAVKTIKKKAPDLIARMIEVSTEAVFIQLELPQAERGEAMAAIRTFTQDIRDGEVSLAQGKRVAEALDNKSLVGAILVRGFEAQYVRSSVLPDAEKDAAHITLTRFVHGVVEDRISQETFDSIMDMISEQGDNENRRLKSSITTAELQAVLGEMQNAADQAAIENREYAVDIAQIIHDAIDQGMKEGDKDARPPLPGN